MQNPEIQIKIDTTELKELIDKMNRLNTLMQDYADKLETLVEYTTDRLHTAMNAINGKVDLNTLEILVRQIMAEEANK